MPPWPEPVVCYIARPKHSALLISHDSALKEAPYSVWLATPLFSIRSTLPLSSWPTLAGGSAQLIVSSAFSLVSSQHPLPCLYPPLSHCATSYNVSFKPPHLALHMGLRRSSWFPAASPEGDSSDDDFFFGTSHSDDTRTQSQRNTDPIFPLASIARQSSANSTTVFQPASFLSSDDSSDDDHLFALTPSYRRRKKPRRINTPRSTFIIGGKLGEGAYGTVREGIDEHSLKIVAIKILDTKRLRKLRGGVEAIRREVAIQRKLRRHKNLIELIDAVEAKEKSKIYIILEMANGSTVQQLADRAQDRRLPESQVQNFAFQTLKGLQYMHGKGVVHRDIKPANLMLTASGLLKISDFGVAEFLNEYDKDDNVSKTSGSPAFQAPEIATGALGYSGRKVDVWALGVTIYYLLTGKIPFEADNLYLLFELIGRGEYEEPEWMNEPCKQVLREMLTVDWEKRSGVDQLLKNSWVTRGDQTLTQDEQKERGWIPVKTRQSEILNNLGDYCKTDEQDGPVPQRGPATTASASTASQTSDPFPLNRFSTRGTQSSRGTFPFFDEPPDFSQSDSKGTSAFGHVDDVPEPETANSERANPSTGSVTREDVGTSSSQRLSCTIA